ncbi:MAG: glycoside hydrolase family 52 protein, partial [Planctomycetota bacterium]
SGNDPYSQLRQITPADHAGVAGLVQGTLKGIFSADSAIRSDQAFAIEAIVRPYRSERKDRFALGPVGLMFGDAPAGQTSTFRFAVAFYNHGVVTSGEPAVYFYSRYFENLEAVGRYALDHFDAYLAKADAADALLAEADHLNDDQRWQLCHAVHSYYASTQLLDLGTAPALSLNGREPCWVVNEGEYRMMNTFDLTVDMLFFEMRMNPWTTRNVLDRYVDRYAYRDRLHFPGQTNTHPGGVTFTHDQGVANHFTPPGFSSYELSGLQGCFSYMSCEQLTNFVCCVATYDHVTGDHAWTTGHTDLLADCLESLCNRDQSDPAQRNGLMALDSSRTGDGAEITTYDSLDMSLGQARHNVYLGVKCWASYVLLQKLFTRLGRSDEAELAAQQASRSAETIAGQADEHDRIPAVLFEDNAAYILPVVEGLVFPFVAGAREALAADGPYAEFLTVLRKHLDAVLRPGLCLFDDGGWKLSSTSINSWLSKIYLGQFVIRHVLKHGDAAGSATADRAHAGWLKRDENAYWAWSDQMHAGTAKGSRYYPRGVTSALWLTETDV